jgi:hypothetical protein
MVKVAFNSRSAPRFGGAPAGISSKRRDLDDREPRPQVVLPLDHLEDDVEITINHLVDRGDESLGV